MRTHFTIALLCLCTAAGGTLAKDVTIQKGVGADGIQVGISTEQDVISKYGNQFEKIEHLEYSYQLKYPALNMSFYYCRNDPAKKLFTIEYLRGATSDGIVIGKSTLADVQKLHQSAVDQNYCDEGLCSYSYGDIAYFTKDADGTDAHEQKIVEIDVQPTGFKDCDSGTRPE